MEPNSQLSVEMRWVKVRRLFTCQIRAARDKLEWAPSELAKRAGLALSIVRRAEATEGEAVITIAQIAALRSAFSKAGVTFGPDTDSKAP